MPNRITREGILSSDRVDLLSAPAEVFYRRLMSVVDDYGRYDGRLSVLIAYCYPLRIAGKRRVREANVKDWLNECRIAGLVVTYQAIGKDFLAVLDFRQQVRSASKYPEPPPDAAPNSTCAADATQTPSTRAASAHLDGDVVVSVSVSGGVCENAREADPLAPPIGVSPDNWAAWRKHRGKRFTAEAERLQRKHLAEWQREGHDPNRIVENALAGGWQGLHPPDAPKHTNGRSRGPPTLAERRVNTIDNIINSTIGKADERTIEGTAERVDREAPEALSVDLREHGRGRLRHDR